MNRLPLCQRMLMAYRAGKKTMTRRVIHFTTLDHLTLVSPRYARGETVCIGEALRQSASGVTVYDADGEPVWRDGQTVGWPWKVKRLPSIYMPAWAAREWARIAEVWPERLQNISIDDIVAEGAWNPAHSVDEDCSQAYEAFSDLWDSINGDKPGFAWDDDPWVWVYTLERVRGKP